MFNVNYYNVKATESQIQILQTIAGFEKAMYPHKAKIEATGEIVNAFVVRFATVKSKKELTAEIGRALGDNIYPRYNEVQGFFSSGGCPLHKEVIN